MQLRHKSFEPHSTHFTLRRSVSRSMLLPALWGPARALARPSEPILIALDLEFGHRSSESDDAIKAGAQIAASEINRAGGLLGGRPLAFLESDNRSVPARAIANVRRHAQVPEVVAVYCGKFSPVALELLPTIHELGILLLDPWAAADGITEHSYRPSYSFRLSMRDSWAIRKLLRHARDRELHRLAAFLPNTSWGRSCARAIDAFAPEISPLRITRTNWYNWGQRSLLNEYAASLESGADGILLVANEVEASILVIEMAARPVSERLPVLSHWGLTGGNFVELTRGSLESVDMVVVQTFSFLGRDVSPRAAAVAEAAMATLARSRPEDLPAPVGIAHAYDLTHILALAIELAGTADRRAVRDALERVEHYDGLIRTYRPPFAPNRHDALTEEEMLLARYQPSGGLFPVDPGKPWR